MFSCRWHYSISFWFLFHALLLINYIQESVLCTLYHFCQRCGPMPSLAHLFLWGQCCWCGCLVYQDGRLLCLVQDPLNHRLHHHWGADSGSRLGMGGCVCHVVVSGSQVVDQGAGARGTSAAGGPVSHVQLPLQPSFLCCRHCHGQGSPSHVSASPATSGFSGAAVSAAMVGRPGLQAPTPLVPRFCLFSVLQSNHLFFLFLFFFHT